MINEESFWRIIEKNKNNPINFKEEVNSMSLEDMYKFYILIEKMEEPFFKNDKVKNFIYHLQENNIYTNLYLDDITFRGKEFYDSFVNCNKEKVVKMLKENPNWKIGIMEPKTIWIIYGMKVATVDEIEKLISKDRQTMWTCLDRFWNKIDKLRFQ